ncbi:unnamed protein product [Colias eurytheme]|nr:unnamed protein product [Colias eurytheme]
MGSASLLALLDFSRAFDSINFELMISKLRFYGFDDGACKWFDSYLRDRVQRVILNNNDGSSNVSSELLLTRGVPQGSILGPLLFIIYSADITRCLINSNYHLYADDLQIYSRIKYDNVAATLSGFTADLSRIATWASNNSLLLNPVKSKYMIIGTKGQVHKAKNLNLSISIDGFPIQEVEEARNLGVIFDSNLKFESHILEIVKGCFYRLKVMYV